MVLGVGVTAGVRNLVSCALGCYSDSDRLRLNADAGAARG
jgi:hypothetical protein